MSVGTVMQSPLRRQTASFFGAQAANALLGLVVAYVLTAALSEVEYGRYQFLLGVFLIVAVFFDFGLNASVKRLSAVSPVEKARRIAGSGAIVSVFLGIALVAVLIGISFFIDPFFEKSAGSGSVLRAVAPFAVLYLLYELMLSVSQGMNRIGTLSVATVIPRSVFVVALLVLGLALEQYGALSALVLFLVSYAIAGIAVFIFLKPLFTALRDTVQTIYVEMKEFGFDLYYGRIIDGVTNGFDKILITKFHGLIPTGFYGLAMTLVLPVSMFSRALSASVYKRFTTEDSIPAKTLWYNTAGSIVSGAGVVVLCIYGVPALFPDRFTETLTVVPYLAAGSVLAGLNQPYHTFFAAKRQGRVLKIMSFATSGVNIVLNIVLIPLFSMYGAAAAYISTYGLNYGMNVFYYRRFVNGTQRSGGNNGV